MQPALVGLDTDCHANTRLPRIGGGRASGMEAASTPPLRKPRAQRGVAACFSSAQAPRSAAQKHNAARQIGYNGNDFHLPTLA
ncbi:hypothetical protein P3W85_39280 [Cupriavidus basilensis]|uniref:Uncharacterized protein n=1 Tax=Cupriavidus basilensis TaxID=68895 RepID=A0ABT6B215_9BURK|nr:hypothetical protein [Cupriavidus basilensis]MDF3838937.1 hypothetical protein [Cupriavidus basilensis]